MGYWKWLGKGIRYALLLRWLPSLRCPAAEGIGGGAVFGAVAALLATEVGGYWWTMPAIVAFLLLTHGWYRDFGKLI